MGELDDLSSIESDQIGGKKKQIWGREGERSKKCLPPMDTWEKTERLHPVFHSFDNAKTSTNRSEIERKMLSFVQKTQ